LELSEEALSNLATAGFDPTYGARPLKRAIQKEVMNPMAMKLLSGEIREGQTVVVDVENGLLVFHAHEPAKSEA